MICQEYKEFLATDHVIDNQLVLVLVSFGMLLEESHSPMDFSRGSELSTDFASRQNTMEHLNARTNDHKGLDLTSSVLERLSQKAMRSGIL